MPDVKRKTPEENHIQSVWFLKSEWEKSESQEWLSENNFFSDGYDETDQYHRWRQYNPEYEKFKYRIIKKKSNEKNIFLVYAIQKEQKEKGEEAMQRIEIRGVIVPADYDTDFFSEYIRKGVITPESVVRKKISELSKELPLNVYIHSPGGSVWAAYEIINGLNDWKKESGQEISVTLGGLVASAGATIALLSAEKIFAHSNSKMMLHGAWTETIGGAEIHLETHQLLEKINLDVKNFLVRSYGIAQEEVDAWFESDKEKWFNAEELKRYGIVKKIIDEENNVEDFPVDFSAMGPQGIAIAAFFQQKKTNESEKKEKSEYEKGFQDGSREIEKQLLPRIEELEEKIFRRDELIKKFQSEKDTILSEYQKKEKKYVSEIEILKAENKNLELRISKLTLSACKFAPVVETWEQALRDCQGDYVAARKKYPEIWKRTINLEKRR